MSQLQQDNVLHAAVMIAKEDGVSVLEVFERGATDMALRVALSKLQQEG